MNETNLNVILESLAETIRNLRTEVEILKYENKRLKEEKDNYFNSRAEKMKEAIKHA